MKIQLYCKFKLGGVVFFLNENLITSGIVEKIIVKEFSIDSEEDLKRSFYSITLQIPNPIKGQFQYYHLSTNHCFLTEADLIEHLLTHKRLNT